MATCYHTTPEGMGIRAGVIIRELSTELCDGRHFEVKPDVVADFTNMPYPVESFSMVVFDPPSPEIHG